MKYITILLIALFANSAEAIRNAPAEKTKVSSRTANMFPEKLGDKNKDTVEKTWAEYQKNRPHLIDCFINEKKNWYGNHRCTESWECKGARVCEEYARAPGASKDSISVGWCKGPDACPVVGPLDHFDANGLKLNPGSHDRRDVKE